MWRLRRAGWNVWHEPAARVVRAGGVATKIRDPETELTLPQRTPRYSYEPRRRYFTLVGGRANGLASGLACLMSHMFWRVCQLMSHGRGQGTLRPAADVIAFGWWCACNVTSSTTPQFSGEVSPTPAWMKAVE